MPGSSEPGASYPEKELKASSREHRSLPLCSATGVQDWGRSGEPLISLFRSISSHFCLPD